MIAIAVGVTKNAKKAELKKIVLSNSVFKRPSEA